MSSAFIGADAIDTCFQRPHRASRALRRYERETRKALAAFTWFIYRIREPAMRNLFMSPRNWFRLEESMMSLFAGDVFDNQSHIMTRLAGFKLIYYLTKFSHLRHRIGRRRRENSSPLDAAV